jgi:hypothetical protein
MKCFWVLSAGLLALPAVANISYTCDATSFAANAPANACALVNGSNVAGIYNGIFSNVSANIYVQFGATGVGSSNINLISVPYSAYYNALKSHSNDPAVNTLTSVDPIAGAGNTDQMIDVSAALGAALGLAGAADAGINSIDDTACTLGSPNCYNGIITLSNQSPSIFYYPTSPSDNSATLVDIYAVLQHETDEVLGTISCIASNNGAAIDQCGSTDASAADLFRYASAGTPTFLNADNGSTAYFSVNGGVSPATPDSFYINAPSIGDYGDWVLPSGPPNVQDGEVSEGFYSITTDDGSEIQALNAVGFNTVPEPGTMTLLGAALAGLWLARKRILHGI